MKKFFCLMNGIALFSSSALGGPGGSKVLNIVTEVVPLATVRVEPIGFETLPAKETKRVSMQEVIQEAMQQIQKEKPDPTSTSENKPVSWEEQSRSQIENSFNQFESLNDYNHDSVEQFIQNTLNPLNQYPQFISVVKERFDQSSSLARKTIYAQIHYIGNPSDQGILQFLQKDAALTLSEFEKLDEIRNFFINSRMNFHKGTPAAYGCCSMVNGSQSSLPPPFHTPAAGIYENLISRFFSSV